MRAFLNNVVIFSQLAESIRQFFSGVSLLNVTGNFRDFDSANDCLVRWSNHDTAFDSA